MKIRCVLIDDEKPARERLKRLLAGHPDLELVGEAADAAAAVELLDRLEPDLCFLDVQMPEGDGFKVLSEAVRVPGVIFTTAYDAYAVRAFEVNSLDYLLKPFSKKRFAEALDRARRSLVQPEVEAGRVRGLLDEVRRGAADAGASAAAAPARISARRGSRIVLLDPANVLCFEAEQTLVFARTAEGRFLVERTLTQLEQLLGAGFFRAHRGCLVSLARIAEIQPIDAGTYRIILADAEGSAVPLSRRQARKLRELFQW
jgi:two-component system LytT family response regulator